MAYSHVLGGQLLLQPPQLILLPEEHPQELRGERQTLTRETNTLQQAGVNGEEEHVANVQGVLKYGFIILLFKPFKPHNTDDYNIFVI